MLGTFVDFREGFEMRHKNKFCHSLETPQEYNNTLDLFVKQLSFIDSLNDENSSNSMKQIFNYFRQNCLLPAIDWLINNSESEEFKEVCSRSYMHANGFTKVVLFVGSGGEKLRLHYWPKGTNAEENIHCHRWKLSSLILFGLLNSELYHEDTSESSRNLCCYLYKKNSGIASSIFLGDISLKLTEKNSKKDFDFYQLPQGQLHRIVDSGKSETATLMFQSSPTKSWNSLVTTKAEVKPELNPPKLSIEELINILCCVKSQLLEEEICI